MFGYVVPLTGEMKVRELNVYRAYYCGLCRALKSEYRKTAVLNFDSVFLYLLADGLRGGAGEAEPVRCAVNPMKKRPAVVTPAARFAADINILMAYYSAEDHVRDGKPGMRLARAFLKKAFSKAKARHESVVRVADETIAELIRLEREKSPNTDAAADSYARLLGTVMMDADILQSHILYDIGYSLGRWIYLIDAAEDWEEDLKRGDYNVYACKYGQPDVNTREKIGRSLYYTLSQAGQALSRLELKQNRDLLENIVYLGCREQTRTVLETGKRITVPVEKRI